MQRSSYDKSAEGRLEPRFGMPLMQVLLPQRRNADSVRSRSASAHSA